MGGDDSNIWLTLYAVPAKYLQELRIANELVVEPLQGKVCFWCQTLGERDDGMAGRHQLFMTALLCLRTQGSFRFEALDNIAGHLEDITHTQSRSSRSEKDRH